MARPYGRPAEHRGAYSGENKKGCWLWTGKANTTSASGAQHYGKATVGGKTLRVHRAVFAAVYGYEPKVVLHRCDEGLCFRPDHLVDGDQSANILDCVAKGRHHRARTETCPRGHGYDSTNTYVVPATGYRQCRACNRMRSAQRAQRERMERASRRAA